jgi:GT2 family glycosyltransferase
MQILSGCGAAVLYRREAFVESGGLDPDFFAYLDDLDLALRVQLLGFGGLYLPDAVAYHVGSATLGQKLHPRVVEYITRNQIYLLTKNYPQGVFRKLRRRIIAYQILWALFAMGSGGIGAYLRGLRSVLRNRHSMRRKHLELMNKRRIGDDEFLQKIRASERQIHAWHIAQPAAKKSALLHLYFRLFGCP